MDEVAFRRDNTAERWAGIRRSTAWYLPALALGAVFGSAAALGSLKITILAFGAMGGLVLLFAPLHVVLGFFITLTFLVVGPLASIGRIKQVEWAPYLIAVILLMRVPMEWFHTSTIKYRRPGVTSEEVSPVVWAVVSYFTLILISIVLNRPTPLQGLVGAKLYVFVWGVFFLLVVSPISPKVLEQMWRGFLVIAVLQFPFALYQRLVEVPKRGMTVSRLDAVVGSFPGTEMGGASGALAVFLVFSMALAISLWRNKLLSGTSACIVIIASLASIALGEVKVILVLFPLAFIVLNRRELVWRPLYFLGTGFIVVSLLGGILWVYRDAAKIRSGPDLTMSQHIERSVNYILDPNEIHFQTGEVGRFAALNLWLRDGRRTPQTMLLGYSPAASQNSTLGRGELASRYYPLKINGTTTAGMLWDIGALGFASFVAVIVIAFFQALRLSSLAHIPPFHRSALDACAVLLALVGVTLPYNNDILITPPLQVLFLIALAQVVYWQSRANAQNYSSSM